MLRVAGVAHTARARGTPAARPMHEGLLIGIGMGGLLDVIVIHGILQWHHLISDLVPPTTVEALERNLTADAVFQLVAWLATGIGIALLWRNSRRAGPDASVADRRLLGSILIGWAGFNLADGVFVHYVLRWHHVRGGSDALASDLAFFTVSVLIAVAGWMLLRGAARAGGRDAEPGDAR